MTHDEFDANDLHLLLDGPVGPTAHLAGSARKLARRRSYCRTGAVAVLAAAGAVVSVPLLLSNAAPSDALLAAPGAPAEAAAPSPLEVNQLIADCLRTEGFEVQVKSDGYELETQGGAEARAFHQAEYDCSQQHGQDAPGPHTDAQLGQRYDVIVAVRDCLVGRGLPVAEDPGRESFVADYGDWSPYDNHETTIGQAPDCDDLASTLNE